MSNRLVSVVIPTFNRERYLDLAIQSVVGQTYSDVEIIVVDDGSNTNYAESICNKYANCYYYYKSNGGISSARNYGIKKAKGVFVAFLDDDDLWAPTKLDIQVAILENNPNVDLVHSKVAIIDELGHLTGEFGGASADKLHKRSGYVFWNALGCWIVKPPTPLIRKCVFKTDLIFDEALIVGEDVDFYQRLFFRHRVYYVNEPLAYYREYDNQERLSLQTKLYIGVEEKMYQNFKGMGIQNPFLLYFIAIKLVKRAIEKWNLIYVNEQIKINRLILYCKPIYYLNKLF